MSEVIGLRRNSSQVTDHRQYKAQSATGQAPGPPLETIHLKRRRSRLTLTYMADTGHILGGITGTTVTKAALSRARLIVIVTGGG